MSWASTTMSLVEAATVPGSALMDLSSSYAQSLLSDCMIPNLGVMIIRENCYVDELLLVVGWSCLLLVARGDLDRSSDILKVWSVIGRFQPQRTVERFHNCPPILWARYDMIGTMGFESSKSIG